MAPRIRTSTTSPRPKNRDFFYPGEVVRILKLEGLDYRQLRRLFRIVKEDDGAPVLQGSRWSRFTFRDLVALKAAIRLAGGEGALASGKRLRLQDVETVCKRLREDMGVSQPLTELVFYRKGRTIVAQAEGILFEPISGQMMLSEVKLAVAQYLNEGSTVLGEIEGGAQGLDQDVPGVKESPRLGRAVGGIEVRFR